MSNTIYFNWRNFRDRIFWRVGGKIRKNYFHKKYFHPLRIDVFRWNTFLKLFHENKFPRKILFGLFCEKKITEKKHFHENKYQDLNKKFQYIYVILFSLLKFSAILFNARFLVSVKYNLIQYTFIRAKNSYRF